MLKNKVYYYTQQLKHILITVYVQSFNLPPKELSTISVCVALTSYIFAISLS